MYSRSYLNRTFANDKGSINCDRYFNPSQIDEEGNIMLELRCS